MAAKKKTAKKTTKPAAKKAAKKVAPKGKATTARAGLRLVKGGAIDLGDDGDAVLDVEVIPAKRKGKKAKPSSASKSKRAEVKAATAAAFEVVPEDDHVSARTSELIDLETEARSVVDRIVNEYTHDLADNPAPRSALGYESPVDGEIYRGPESMRVELSDAEITDRAKSAAVAAMGFARLSALQAALGGTLKKLARSYDARVQSLLKEVDSGHGWVPVLVVQRLSKDGKRVEFFRCDTEIKINERPATPEEQQTRLPGVR